MVAMMRKIVYICVWISSLYSGIVAQQQQQQCSNNEIQVTQQKPPLAVAPTQWLPASVEWQTLPTQKVLSYSTAYFSSSTASADSEQICADSSSVAYQSAVIGRMPQFGTKESLHVLDVAVQAWKGGAGVWTAGFTTQQRVDAIRAFFAELKLVREEIVTILQWEIGKNRIDAESEFDRTVQFCELLIATLSTDPEFQGRWEPVPGSTVTALTKRAAIGVILALAPYNYPINESYATILPALLTGNIVILKIPTIGGLAHLLTMKAFAKALPPGTINFISGSGRTTMPPLMESGKIDGLAFIGGHNAADALIHAHPHPHRLHTFLQLEAKNIGILLTDLFAESSQVLLDNAVAEAVLGSLSFNGQRCTALKLFFVPRSHAETFVAALVKRIEGMTVGLPWQKHGSNATVDYSQITPLPNRERIQFMQSLISDATEKGAKIVNAGGGTIIGGSESTLMVPAVLYPVTPDMKIYTEEQFGPLVPISVYDDLETVLMYGESSQYAQQVSIFGQHVDTVATIIDRFGAVFGKVNLNAQCGRSPDTLAFSGRRSSAMGVMSVTDALREFSVPTVIAYKNSNSLSTDLVDGLNKKSVFLDAGMSTATKA